MSLARRPAAGTTVEAGLWVGRQRFCRRFAWFLLGWLGIVVVVVVVVGGLRLQARGCSALVAAGLRNLACRALGHIWVPAARIAVGCGRGLVDMSMTVLSVVHAVSV